MAESYMMRRYNSIHKFLDVCEKGADVDGSSHRTDGGTGRNWAGTVDFGQALNYARNGGWEPEFAPTFRNVFDELVPKLRKFVQPTMNRTIGFVGDDVDIEAYVRGMPEFMVGFQPDEDEVSSRAFCLIIGHSISAGCTSAELFVRGQAIIGLVRALSLMGMEIEIWSEETVSRVNTRATTVPAYYSTLVKIHGAGEVMDESAIEFAVGNPSWLRRLLFGAQEAESEKIRNAFGFKPGKSYGHCVSVQHANLVGADITLDLGRSWFGEYRPEAKDPQDLAKAGVDWVVRQLKELGVVEQNATLDWSLD